MAKTIEKITNKSKDVEVVTLDGVTLERDNSVEVDGIFSEQKESVKSIDVAISKEVGNNANYQTLVYGDLSRSGEKSISKVQMWIINKVRKVGTVKFDTLQNEFQIAKENLSTFTTRDVLTTNDIINASRLSLRHKEVKLFTSKNKPAYIEIIRGKTNNELSLRFTAIPDAVKFNEIDTNDITKEAEKKDKKAQKEREEKEKQNQLIAQTIENMGYKQIETVMQALNCALSLANDKEKEILIACKASLIALNSVKELTA